MLVEVLPNMPMHLPGVAGSSGFAATSQATGPRDSKGRSLREFDLTTRLMKYPLSYMIYSPAFAALPPPAKRQVITEILKETM